MAVPAWMEGVSHESADELIKLGYTSLEKLTARYKGVNSDEDRVTKLCKEVSSLTPEQAGILVKKMRKLQVGNTSMGILALVLILVAGIATAAIINLPMETRDAYVGHATNLYNRINEEYKKHFPSPQHAMAGGEATPQESPSASGTKAPKIVFVPGSSMDDLKAAFSSSYEGDMILDLGGKTFEGELKKPFMILGDRVTIRKGSIIAPHSMKILTLAGEGIVLDSLTLKGNLEEGDNQFGRHAVVESSNGATATIKKCTIKGGHVAVGAYDGGVVEVLSSHISGIITVGEGSKVVAKRSRIKGNRGTGVLVENGGHVELEACQVSENGSEGLAITDGSSLVAHKVRVENNDGALWVDDGSFAELHDTYLGGAGQDAVHALAGGLIHLYNCELENPKPTQSTGGLVITKS